MRLSLTYLSPSLYHPPLSLCNISLSRARSYYCWLGRQLAHWLVLNLSSLSFFSPFFPTSHSIYMPASPTLPCTQHACSLLYNHGWAGGLLHGSAWQHSTSAFSLPAISHLPPHPFSCYHLPTPCCILCFGGTGGHGQKRWRCV